LVDSRGSFQPGVCRLVGSDGMCRGALTECAEELFTHIAKQAHEINVVVQKDEAAPIFDVCGQPAKGGWWRPLVKSSIKSGQLSSADSKAMEESGLCYYHFANSDLMYALYAILLIIIACC